MRSVYHRQSLTKALCQNQQQQVCPPSTVYERTQRAQFPRRALTAAVSCSSLLTPGLDPCRASQRRQRAAPEKQLSSHLPGYKFSVVNHSIVFTPTGRANRKWEQSKTFLVKQGTEQTNTAPGSSQTNAIFERRFKNILAAARTAMKGAPSPLNLSGYWSLAALYAIDRASFLPF